MPNNEIIRLGALALRDDGTYAPFSGEAWLYALQMTLIGMGMIFAVLGILWGALAIFKLIFARNEGEKKEKATLDSKAEKESKPVTVEAPTAAPAPVAAASADDAELIAVLTAAIAAYEAEQGRCVSVGDFRVVSYRRANGGRSWNSK